MCVIKEAANNSENGSYRGFIRIITDLFGRVRANRFAQDSFWAILGNVIGKGMSLLATIIIARFLGKEVYGEFGTIKTTVVNISILSTFGLGYTATKYVAEFKKVNRDALQNIFKKIFWITTWFSVILAICLFALSSYVAQYIFEAPHLSNSIKLISAFIVFNSLTNNQIGILSGLNAFRAMARINTYIGIIAFTASLILTYLWKLNGALIALLLTQLFQCFLYYKEITRQLPKGSLHVADFTRSILKFSLPIALQETCFAIMAWLTIILLMQIGDYGEVGIYTAALQWMSVLLFIPGILRNVILSHLSSRNDSIENHNKILRRSLVLGTMTTLIPAIILVVVFPYIATIYGNEFQGLTSVVIILSITAIFLSLSNILTQAYMSLGLNWTMLVLRIIRDTLVIILFITLAKVYNNKALVLSYSYLLSSIIFLIIMSFTYKRLHRDNLKKSLENYRDIIKQ